MKMKALVGLSHSEDILGKSDYELPWHTQSEAILKADAELVQSQKELILEESFRIHDGTRRRFND